VVVAARPDEADTPKPAAATGEPPRSATAELTAPRRVLEGTQAEGILRPGVDQAGSVLLGKDVAKKLEGILRPAPAADRSGPGVAEA